MSYTPGPRDDWASWDAPTTPMGGEDRATRRAAIPPLPRPARQQAPTAPRDVAPPPLPAWITQRPPVVRPAPARTPPARRPPRWLRTIGLVLLALSVLMLLAGGIALRRFNDFGTAISTKGPFTTQTGFMSGSDHVNILVMGYGGAGHDGANLTDSMMVMSLVPSTGATTLISVPRDLWVQVPPDSGTYAKLNTAYNDGLNNGFDGEPAGKVAGGNEAARKVSDILGIPVDYWLTIDFTGFRQLVDALGGVDVNVPVAFTANYPRNDDPAIDAGWKTVTFKTGPQHMNGERAIEYARARYVLEPASQGTDFARSERQQILLRAILTRAKQPSAWPGLNGALNALEKTLYTNLSLSDLTLFAQKMDLARAQRVTLQDVLADATADDGESILVPASGNWDDIRSYVASKLKS